MASSRFPRGSTVYDKHGRSYVVEDADAGMVFCSADNGAEVEFPESALVSETEFRAKSSGGRREVSYTRLKQSKHFMPPSAKLDKNTSQTLLTKLERLSPGILDFAAHTACAKALQENKEQDLVAALSIPKCREVFDAAPIDARAALVANMLGTPPAVLVGMANMGEAVLRAMLDKGLAAQGDAFTAFRNRPRK